MGDGSADHLDRDRGRDPRSDRMLVEMPCHLTGVCGYNRLALDSIEC